MSEPAEREIERSYRLSGMAPKKTWEKLGELARKLGLDFEPADENTEQQVVGPTRMLHNLGGIVSPENLVGTEHAGEYRGIYMGTRRGVPGLPSIPLLNAKNAFCRLVEPSRIGSAPVADAAATREYAEELGLVVQSRRTAGFPDHEYSETVVTAGSLIDVVRKLELAPQSDHPKHLNKRTMPFLGAFATHLEAQIENHQHTLPR